MEDQHAAALRFEDARVQALFHVLVLFTLLPNGFSNQEARDRLSGLRGRIVSAGSMTYDLRRLKLHGLIERLAGTRRYHVTKKGLRLAMFFTRTYDRLLRPALATITPKIALDASRLRTALRHFEDAVAATCTEARLAA